MEESVDLRMKGLILRFEMSQPAHMILVHQESCHWMTYPGSKLQQNWTQQRSCGAHFMIEPLQSVVDVPVL